MSKLVWLIALGVAGVMTIAATSRGDDNATGGEPSHPPLSPDLSTPLSSPAPAGAKRPRLPSEPYDIGPPSAVWQYEQLSAEDKAVVDHSRDTAQSEQFLDVYAQAAQEQAEQATFRMSASMLGVGGLNELGVVP